jgi:hypothetical protein
MRFIAKLYIFSTHSIFGDIMQKLRGKQPTKPDQKKALQKRQMELKGTEKATLTVPIIYRKTFNWDSPEISFVPINHRSFVIYRGDLDREEYKRDKYTKITLDIDKLPEYATSRIKCSEVAALMELKEAILAASLRDRFVQITIPKPKDKKLYECIKEDIEDLMSELGFEFSTDHKGIQCTFKFPKHDIEYYSMESKNCVKSALESLHYFRSQLLEKRFTGVASDTNELIYNIQRLELLMDRYFTDAMNIIWDLPNISSPGYFLWIYSCERILDEFLFIAKETNNAIKSLKPEDLKHFSKAKDIFSFVWDKAVENGLDFCSDAISTISLESNNEYLSSAFTLIFNYEQHQKTIGKNQDKFIKYLTAEESYLKDKASAQRLLTASYHLNNIFQASERIIVYSTSIAKNSLRINLYDKTK